MLTVSSRPSIVESSVYRRDELFSAPANSSTRRGAVVGPQAAVSHGRIMRLCHPLQDSRISLFSVA